MAEVRILGMAIIVVLVAISPVRAGGCLSYRPALVTLGGKVRMVWAYGPPGFGEDPVHDQRGEYAVLDLDKRICLTRGEGDEIARSGIASVQLLATDKHHFDSRLLGADVTVDGTLWPRESGGVTDVLLDYTSIHPVP